MARTKNRTVARTAAPKNSGAKKDKKPIRSRAKKPGMALSCATSSSLARSPCAISAGTRKERSCFSVSCHSNAWSAKSPRRLVRKALGFKQVLSSQCKKPPRPTWLTSLLTRACAPSTAAVLQSSLAIFSSHAVYVAAFNEGVI